MRFSRWGLAFLNVGKGRWDDAWESFGIDLKANVGSRGFGIACFELNLTIPKPKHRHPGTHSREWSGANGIREPILLSPIYQCGFRYLPSKFPPTPKISHHCPYKFSYPSKIDQPQSILPPTTKNTQNNKPKIFQNFSSPSATTN